MLMRRRDVQAFALVGLTFLTYASALGNGFVSDDLSSIVLGRTVHSLRNLPQIFLHDAMWNSVGDAWARSTTVDTYRPIPVSTFLIEHAVYGNHPAGYHLDSILFHVVNVLLVWALGRRLRLGPRASIAAAALFAVHPGICEAVHWINGRSDPLSVGFVLAALLLWLPSLADTSLKIVRAAGIVLLVFCATLSKETTFVLVPVLVIGLGWGRAPLRRLSLLGLPWAIGLLLGFCARTLVLGRSASGSSGQLGYALLRMPLIWRDSLVSLIAPSATLRASLYTRYQDASLGQSLLALLLVSVMVALAVLAWRKRVLLVAVFVACWLSLLAPVALLTSFPGWSGWGRYLYPVAPLAVLAVADVARRWQRPRLLAVVAGAAVGLFSVLTFTAGADFRSERDYGLALIEQDPNCAEGYLQVGTFDAFVQRPLEAIPRLQQGLALAPKNAAGWSSLAWSYLAVGRISDAFEAARRTRAIDPSNKMARFVEASVLIGQGKQEEAAAVLIPLLADDATSEGLWRTTAEALVRFGLGSAFVLAVEAAARDPQRAKIQARLHALLAALAKRSQSAVPALSSPGEGAPAQP
jgi:hypothetical protein